MAVDYLFIVRHGETKANEEGIEAGPLDYPLAKKGVKDAEFIAKTLSKIKIDAVYSSPIFRAVETAKILARPHKLKVKTLEELTEAKFKPRVRRQEGKAPHPDHPRGLLRDERRPPGADGEGHRDHQEGG